jgi:hypothetical protein
MSTRMTGWPKMTITLFSILKWSNGIILMNATDVPFQQMDSGNIISQHIAEVGSQEHLRVPCIL